MDSERMAKQINSLQPAISTGLLFREPVRDWSRERCMSDFTFLQVWLNSTPFMKSIGEGIAVYAEGYHSLRRTPASCPQIDS